MLAFFQMGGYGFYVWMSYGMAALVWLLNLKWALSHASRS